MELRLCFVTSLLSCTLLRVCISESFVGKVLDLNTNLCLLGKWPRSSPTSRRAMFACFSLFFFSSCRLATFHSEVENRRKPRPSGLQVDERLKEGPNKLLTTRFCSKLSSVKCFAQTRECFKGVKRFICIFVSHSLLSFGCWENLKVLTLDFEWFSS